MLLDPALPEKMRNPSTMRAKYLTRWRQLQAERSSWRFTWMELSRFVLPWAGRFFIQDRDRGYRRNLQIYDNTGTRALRILAAGMMSNLTSPAKPWFELEIGGSDLMGQQPVKLWLDQCTKLMLQIFQRSNTYRSLHSMYEELATFGTASCVMMPNFENVIHLYPLTCGEYAIATDFEGNVNTLYREFQKPVGQLVEEFGYDNCSTSVKNLFDRGELDQWITVIHAIEPRKDRDPSKAGNQDMPWSSVYFELGSDPEHVLSVSGFRMFPAMCPRWAVSGSDIYGNSPGMEALGDIKQLQHEQQRKAKVIDLQTNPPLQVPNALKNKNVETMPGGVAYYDAATSAAGIKSMFEVNLNLQHLLEDIQDVRQRINNSFFSDLFLMLSQLDEHRMTATEVAQRNEEKMLMLGPVLERLQNEMLQPLVEFTFDQIMTNGLMPPPPEELQGQEIKIKLVSALAQAQRATQTNSIDRFVSSVGAVAQFKPEALDKIDADAYVDIYGDALGIDPKIILPEDQVQQIRDARAKQQQQAQALAAANSQADTAQKLSNAQTEQPSALTGIMNNLTGYT